jgi:tetratricopeptide (TPR) repeat protein
MKRSLLRLLLIIASLLALALLFVRRVPAGSLAVLQNDVGRSDPLLVSAGWHWRIPLWEGLYLYRRDPIALNGEVTVKSKEGVEVRLPYEFKIQLDEERVLKAHRGRKRGEDAEAWTLRMASGHLSETAHRASTYQLLRETLPAPLDEMLRHDLDPLGLVQGSLKVGPGTVPPALLASFSPEKLAQMRRNTGARVAIIGLDGADWDFALPMIRRGELPNLARLRGEGAYGKIRTNTPPLSPLLWTTVATGKSPDVHGINDFLVLDGTSGRLAPISSEFRKVKALWNIASDAGLTSEFIAWWATWPAEPIRGIMVSDRVSYSLFSSVLGTPAGGGETFPAGYFEEIRPHLRNEASVTAAELADMARVSPTELEAARSAAARRGEKGEDMESLATLIRVVASTENYARIAEDLLGRKQPDLFAVYFEGIDEVSHRFAQLEPPRMPGVSEERFRKYSRVVAGFYRLQDRLLGEILKRLSSDTTLIVLSDHGFATGEARPKDFPPFISGQPGLWHSPFGVLILWGKGVKPGPLPTSTLYDILPTVLDLLGLPAAEDLPGKSLRAALRQDFAGGSSLAKISSYEAYGDPLRPAKVGSTQGSGAAAASEAIVETLRSLGYVGPAPEKGGPGGGGEAKSSGNTATTALYHANLASILAAKGDRERAEAEFRLALQSNPDTLSALLGLSRLEERKGHPDQALALLQRIVSRGLQYEPRTLLHMAELFQGAGRGEDGLAYFGQMSASGKDVSVIRTAEGMLYSRMNQPQKAEEALRQALAKEPLSLSAMEELFLLLDREGKLPQLIPDLKAAIQREEGSFMHHNWLGLAYRRQGDLEAAVKELKRAMELGPDQVGPAANLGSIYLQEGRVGEASEVLARALARDPGSPEVRTNLIVALGRQGEVLRARDLFDEGIHLVPGRPSLYNAMAFAYQANGRPGEAAGLLKSSLEIDSHQPEALHLLQQLDPAAAAALPR